MEILTDHSLIASKIEKNIKLYNFNCILSELPKGSILVGGFIRDLILDKEIDNPDLDIIVNKNSFEVGKKISKKFNGKLIFLDKERNIFRVIFREFRLDIACKLNNNLNQDLLRRDLTINSIGYCLESKIIIDPCNGIEDIKKSILRTYKNQNIIDDPLRILRCFRFLSELNFQIEQKLVDLIYVNKNLLCKVAAERIQYELKKIVRGKNAPEAISFINKMQIFNWLQSYEGFSYFNLNSFNTNYLLNKEISAYLPIVYLIEMLDDLSIKKLKFSKIETLNAKLLRKWQRSLRETKIEEFNEIDRFCLHRDLENILPAFILYLPENYQIDWLERWRDKTDRLFHPSNFLNGKILKKYICIDDGPLLGKLLEYLSIELAYERINDFDDAIYKANQWFKQNAPKCD